MARRSDHTREELKELAIQAGLELIEKEGLSGFSGRKLATSIGYTVGTLYNVFGSYDSLMLHLNARTLDEWYAHMQAALDSKKKSNPLHTLAKAYIDFSRTHYLRWTALFDYHLSEGTTLPDWYAPKLTQFFTMVEQLLLPYMGNNHQQARRAARVLWAGIHGICTLSLTRKLDLVKADSPEILAINFIDNYMAGVVRQ